MEEIFPTYQVLVLNRGGHYVPYDVCRNNTVRELEDKIRKNRGFRSSKHYLSFRERKQFGDRRTLGDYNIVSGVTVTINRQEKQCRFAIVRLPDGNIFEHSLYCTPENVLELKREMEKETGIEADKIRLVYKGVELENVKTVQEYIPSEPEVELRLSD